MRRHTTKGIAVDLLRADLTDDMAQRLRGPGIYHKQRRTCVFLRVQSNKKIFKYLKRNVYFISIHTLDPPESSLSNRKLFPAHPRAIIRLTCHTGAVELHAFQGGLLLASLPSHSHPLNAAQMIMACSEERSRMFVYSFIRQTFDGFHRAPPAEQSTLFVMRRAHIAFSTGRNRTLLKLDAWHRCSKYRCI